MTGKDLFDAINNIDKKYLDEVAADMAKESGTESVDAGMTRTGSRTLLRILPGAIAVASVAIIFTIAVAAHIRNGRKPGQNTGKTKDATVTPTPTETVPTVKPGEQLLTLEDAKRLIEELKEEGLLDDFLHNVYLIRDRFDTIAPGEDIGSGFVIIRYALDPEGKTYIDIHSGGGILYYDGSERTALFQPEYVKDHTIPTEPSTVVYQPVTATAPMAEIRAAHPECFELDTSNGLTVAISSFAKWIMIMPAQIYSSNAICVSGKIKWPNFRKTYF